MIKPTAIPIMAYNKLQTGPNIQFGGLNEGLLMELYQFVIASVVAIPDKPPMAKQATILAIMIMVFFNWINLVESITTDKCYCFTTS